MEALKNEVTSEFTKGEVYFLTFRGNLPNHQKIGYISDHIRKVCNNFFVVRETDGAGTDKFHFHAVMKMPEKPKKSWFKKGLHFDFKHVGHRGKTVGAPPPPLADLTQLEFEESISIEPEVVQGVKKTDRVIDKLKESHLKTQKHRGHKERVVNYIFKDLNDESAMYTHYVRYQKH